MRGSVFRKDLPSFYEETEFFLVSLSKITDGFHDGRKKLSNDKSLEVNITISRKKKTHFCLKLDLHCFDEKNENEPKKL